MGISRGYSLARPPAYRRVGVRVRVRVRVRVGVRVGVRLSVPEHEPHQHPLLAGVGHLKRLQADAHLVRVRVRDRARDRVRGKR